MSNLINFDFQSQTVRVELKNGEPLFCLTDVATILEISRSSDLLQVAKDTFVKNETVKRGALDPNGVHKMYSVDSKGRKNEITFINEPNLYRVIFRSNKSEAVKFQNWVFDEVLPSIRKNGSYSTTLTADQAFQLKKAVEQKCKHNSVHYQTVWTALRNHFGKATYREILASDFDEAMAFVESIELNVPQIAHNPNQSYLTQQDALTLAKVMDYARLYAEFAPKIGTTDGQVTVATLYNRNTKNDDDGFFVCYRPRYKDDIDKAMTLFRNIARNSLFPT